MSIGLTDFEALVKLSAMPHIGPVKLRLLIECYGSPVAAVEANPNDLFILPGFGEKVIDSWKKHIGNHDWESDLVLAEQMGVDIVSYTDSRYPQQLLDLPDCPLLLYVRGNIDVLNSQSIAIVGTRFCSSYGKEMAHKFGQELAAMGFPVISGLARGIDTAAHQGAIVGGQTIAVIGSGLANLYPQENAQLADKIAAKGAIVSEFPMKTSPDRQNFPQRNRIVSGLSAGVLLIEAPMKSGAMITIRCAQRQKRAVFVLPSRVDSETFRGNHALLKEGDGFLVENIQDIGRHYGDLFSMPENMNITPTISLEAEERQVLAHMSEEEISFDQIQSLTKLAVTKLNILLMSLVLKQVVKECPGKVYIKGEGY